MDTYQVSRLNIRNYLSLHTKMQMYARLVRHDTPLFLIRMKCIQLLIKPCSMAINVEQYHRTHYQYFDEQH